MKTAGAVWMGVVALASNSGCSGHEAISNRWRAIRIVRDTANARRLISDAERLNLEKADEKKNREQAAFINAMAVQPSIEIDAGTYFRILQQSRAICSKNPRLNPNFIRVIVSSGSAKGQTGWGCQGVDITRENAIP